MFIPMLVSLCFFLEGDSLNCFLGAVSACGCSHSSRDGVFCRYGGVFPSLNMAVKRREQALQDYKRLQSKVEKYEEKEKTGPVMVKLHQVE